MRTLYLREHGGQRQATTIVHDEFNNACYLLTGKWGLRQDVVSLYTMQGSLLAEVKQVTLGLWPKFVLYQNRQRVGVIAKSLGFVRQVIYIRGPSGLGWWPLKWRGVLRLGRQCELLGRAPRCLQGD